MLFVCGNWCCGNVKQCEHIGDVKLLFVKLLWFGFVTHVVNKCENMFVVCV